MKRLLLALLLALLALRPSAAQAALISRSTEISMGREAAQQFEREESVDADPVLTARVQRIGNRLIAAGDATGYPFEFHTVETNEINAFALPGGFVYVFRGLAQLVPGDDALAFILAHEITHVVQHHGVKQLEKSLAIGTLLNFALRPGTTSGVLQLVLDMHYSRHDEAEADRLGLERMAKAGFDPTQAPEAMAVIARASKGERGIPALLRSHPLPESRIAALRRQAQTLKAAPPPSPQVAAGPPLPEEVVPAPPPAPAAPSELFPLQPGMRWTYRVTGPAEHQTSRTTVLEEEPGQPGTYRVRIEMDNGLATTRLLTVNAAGICGCEGVRRELPGVRAADSAGTRHEDQRGSGDNTQQTAAGSSERADLNSQPSTSDQLTPHAMATASRTGTSRSAAGAPLAPPWQVEISLPASLPQEGAEAAWENVRVPAGEFRTVRAVQRSPGGETATVWLAPGVGVVRRAWERTGLVEELKSLHRPAPEEDRKEGPTRETGNDKS